jgi:hypothetical protein
VQADESVAGVSPTSQAAADGPEEGGAAGEEAEFRLRGFFLSNVRVVFLPSGVTKHIQPMDQGILGYYGELSTEYRKQRDQWLKEQRDAGQSTTVTVRQELEWLHQAWDASTRPPIHSNWMLQRQSHVF